MDAEEFDLSIKTLKGELFTVKVNSKNTVRRGDVDRRGEGEAA